MNDKQIEIGEQLFQNFGAIAVEAATRHRANMAELGALLARVEQLQESVKGTVDKLTGISTSVQELDKSVQDNHDKWLTRYDRELRDMREEHLEQLTASIVKSAISQISVGLLATAQTIAANEDFRQKLADGLIGELVKQQLIPPQGEPEIPAVPAFPGSGAEDFGGDEDHGL